MRIAIADQTNLVFSDDFRDGWRWGFERIGCEVRTIDCSVMARNVSSRGPYSSKGWRAAGKQIAQNIIKWNPDLVWCHHGRYIANDPSFLSTLQQAKIHTAVYLCDEPYECGETLKISPQFDTVFSLDPCTVHAHAMQTRKENVFYMPPAVNTERFRMPNLDEKDPHALFLGNASLVPRPAFLKPVEEHFGAERVKVMYWRSTGKGARGWIGLDAYPELYRKAMFGLNVHRNPSMDERCFKRRAVGRRARTIVGLEPASPPKQWGTGFWNEYDLPAAHVNPRFFEMAASGCLVISDSTRSELARLFPMAPRADDAAHMIELLDYFGDNVQDRNQIVHACFSLISTRHTFAHRAAEILLRCGLISATEVSRYTSLGEPRDWLTHQDFTQHGVASSLGQTGHCERYDPRTGVSQMPASGKVNADGSLHVASP